MISGPGKDRLERWDLLISSYLSKKAPNETYVQIKSEVMMGLCILVYSKKEIIYAISDLLVGKVKEGFNGTVGNKGAVIVRYANLL